MNGAPPPQGLYSPATRHGELIFTSGMTPRRNGMLQQTGPIRADQPVGLYREAALLAVENALSAAESKLAAGERIGGVLNTVIYLMTESGFTAHSAVADLASAHLLATFGPDRLGSRTTVGVTMLPGRASLEVQLTVFVETLR